MLVLVVKWPEVPHGLLVIGVLVILLRDNSDRGSEIVEVGLRDRAQYSRNEEIPHLYTLSICPYRNRDILTQR